MMRAEASFLDQIAANIPAGGGPNDKSRFGQSPANLLDQGLALTSMDLQWVATQASTLTASLRTVDWAAAIYDLTGDNQKDPAFGTQAVLWLIDTIAHKVKDASVSYNVPPRPQPTCRNPLWPWPELDHRTGLLSNSLFDSAKVRQVLVNTADLASKVSRVDWRTTTDHHPTCAAQGRCQDLSQELCGTEHGRNVDYHYGGCYWNNYDPVTYQPRNCSRFPCCDGGETWCARNRRPHHACQHWVLMLSGVGGMRRCMSYAASRQEIINRDDSDTVNAQLRDIVAFASRVARSLPPTAINNNKPTDFTDVVSWMGSALQSQLWAATAKSSSHLSAAVSKLPITTIYQKLYIKDDMDGHPGQGDQMDPETLLNFKAFVDVWSSLSAKITAVLSI
jgi:hypothetical protein